MKAEFPLYLALAFYVLSSGLYLASLSSKSRRPADAAALSLLIAVFIHASAVLFRYLLAGYTPITNLHESLSFLAFCMGCFFVYLRKSYRVDGFGAIVVPALTLVLIWAVSLPSDIRPLQPALRSFWLPIHTAFAFIGNGIFFTGFLVSVVYLLLERNIKRKRPASLSGRFPSLETLDTVNYKCMSYGFPFLTIAIITGSIWAETAWGSYWNWDPKETWSLITWIVYAILIHNRLAMGWRGRRTAYLMIAGFISVVVTFLGVNLFIGGLHSYV